MPLAHEEASLVQSGALRLSFLRLICAAALAMILPLFGLGSAQAAPEGCTSSSPSSRTWYCRTPQQAFAAANAVQWPHDPICVKNRRLEYRFSPPNGSGSYNLWYTYTALGCGMSYEWEFGYASALFSEAPQCPPGHVYAENEGTCRPEKEGKNQGPPSCQAGCGNPIYVATGNKYQREPDLSVSPLLGITRHYNRSAWRDTYVAGGFGPNWTFDYSLQIKSGVGIDGKRYAQVSRANGQYFDFIENGTSWTTDADIPQTLTRLQDAQGTLTGWDFYDPLTGQHELYRADGLIESITTRSADSVSLLYETAGTTTRLARAIDQNGRALSFFYHPDGRLARVVAPEGAEYAYVYDTVGRLATVTYPGGGTRTYHYNEPAYTDGSNLPQALTGISIDGARYATFKYDYAGWAVSTEHAGGVERFTVERDLINGWATVTDPLGAQELRQFLFPHGTFKAEFVQRKCPGCIVKDLRFAYDANGYVREQIEAGITTRYRNDAQGRVLERSDAVGTPEQRTIQTDRHPTYGEPTERRTLDATGALVAKTTWTYNTRGQRLVSTQIDPVTKETRITTLSYCEQAQVDAGTCPLVGLVTKIDGPRTDANDITTVIYRAADAPGCATAPTTCTYRKGDLWKVTNALNQTKEILRTDGAGRALSLKDENGVVTDYEYHPRGWLSAVKVRGTNNTSETDDAITRIAYTNAGRVERVTEPDGVFTRYEYDAALRLTDVYDNANHRIHYTLDAAGNREKEEVYDNGGALLRKLSRVYNKLGQLQAAKDAYDRATTFTYDAIGNADTSTDALQRVSDQDYDPLQRLSRTLQDVNGIKAASEFKYDALDQLVTVKDPKGLTTRYQRNALGDLKQLISPDTGTSTFGYDAAGNRTTATDARNETSTTSYDALGRVSTVAYASDTTLNEAYTYDVAQPVCDSTETFAVGRLSKMTDGSGQTQYCYDRRGNLTRKVQTSAGKSLTVRYGYNLADRLNAVTYPSGLRVDYVRNTQGEISGVTTTLPGQSPQVLVSNVVYYPFGPVAEIEYGDGRRLKRTHNLNYQPGVIEDQGPDGLSLGYEFDEVGNLKTLRNGTQSEPALRKYRYDGLYRLDEVKDGATDTVLQGYGYDATGNRTSVTVNGTTTPYTYEASSHRLSKVGATARTYDAMGNTQTVGGAAQSFVYSAAGRMSHAKRNGAVVQSYLYNGNGEQVRRYAGSAATSVHASYDEAGQWLGGYDANAVRQQEVIWLDNLPVGVIASSGAANDKLYYVQSDHLGTPRSVIDPSREKAVWAWPLTGEAFGNSTPDQDPDRDGAVFTFDLRFPGQRADSASGMNYNYFRDYDALTGRYVKSDPVGLNGGPSTYGYVGGSPLVWIDTLGLTQVNLHNPNAKKDSEDPAEVRDYWLHEATKKYKDRPGHCLVYAHGNAANIVDNREGKWVKLRNPDDIKKILEEAGCKPSEPVTFYACRAGEGEFNIARMYSEDFGVDVTAPDKYMYYDQTTDNPVKIYEKNPDGSPDLSRPGRFNNYPVKRP